MQINIQGRSKIDAVRRRVYLDQIADWSLVQTSPGPPCDAVSERKYDRSFGGFTAVPFGLPGSLLCRTYFVF